MVWHSATRCRHRRELQVHDDFIHIFVRIRNPFHLANMTYELGANGTKWAFGIAGKYSELALISPETSEDIRFGGQEILQCAASFSQPICA